MRIATPKIQYLSIACFLLACLFNQTALADKHADNSKALDQALAIQSDKAKARYQYRNPKQTLEFLNIKPGMNVIEILPGNGGWYSKILLPYLGESGKLVGADYPLSMWSYFSFMTQERLEAKKTWIETWSELANTWRTEQSAPVEAFQLAAMPKQYYESADAVLYIRALHHLNRFNDKGGYLDISLNETYKALKPGGLVGIVQHEALEDRPDAWTVGASGYLKKSYIMEKMAQHGFEFVASSDINANPKDQANEGDTVWRLLPSLRVDDAEKKAANKAIGETNRMTLLFKKP